MYLLRKMAAKSCREDNSKWLSFVTQAYDTASVINRLFDNWLSEHELEYLASHHGKCDGSDDEFDENYFGPGFSQEKIWTDVWDKWISHCLAECGFDDPKKSSGDKCKTTNAHNRFAYHE